MLRISILLVGLFSFTASAYDCDCAVWIYAPLTASHQWSPTKLKKYQLEGYGTHSPGHHRACRASCRDAFLQDMSTERLRALLMTYSERLIQQRLLGHNCTGLTTLKYPVRVKASLGNVGLGSVEDRIEIINHEESCFGQ
jgi:hypothetical protein